eukprot:2889259-Rhodomonas_salina.2
MQASINLMQSQQTSSWCRWQSHRVDLPINGKNESRMQRRSAPLAFQYASQTLPAWGRPRSRRTYVSPRHARVFSAEEDGRIATRSLPTTVEMREVSGKVVWMAGVLGRSYILYPPAFSLSSSSVSSSPTVTPIAVSIKLSDLLDWEGGDPGVLLLACEAC